MTINDLAHLHFSMQGYFMSDSLLKSGDDTMRYTGYLNPEGAFYIMEEDLDAGSFRYYFGKEDYSTYWAARESISYQLYSAVV